jgi:hypothetical protein
MEFDSFIKEVVKKEIESQLTNRHIASKSWTKEVVLEWGEKHLAQLQKQIDTSFSDHGGKLTCMRKQIGKLFAMIREMKIYNEMIEQVVDNETVKKKEKKELPTHHSGADGTHPLVHMVQMEIDRLQGTDQGDRLESDLNFILRQT